MADLTVQVELKSKDSPIWINNACCGCQLCYSVDETRELIAQLQFAIDKIEYEKDRLRREALANWTPKQLQDLSRAYSKSLEYFFQDPNPFMEALKRKNND